MKNDTAVTCKVSTLVAWGTILVITQLLITQWTIRSAGNREVIDYISFAGTVVGMILAVLAIVYSYLSTASQRDDSTALRSQIDSLNDAIVRAQASGTEFSDQLERLDEIRQGIGLAASNSAAALEASGRLEGVLAEMQGNLQKPIETAAQPAPAALDKSAALKFIASRAIPRQSIFYYLAVNEDADNFDDEKNELLGLLDEGKSANQIRRVRDEGEIRGYYWIFYDMNAVKDTDNRRALLGALLLRINNYDDDAYSRAGGDAARKVVALVKEKIQQQLG